MISKKTKYALKALTVLAEDYPNPHPVLISDLATSAHVPKKFLELILLELKNVGILQSKKGKGGGYILAKPPRNIALGTVMRILEGPLAPLPCLSQSSYQRCEECTDENTCTIRLTLKELHDAQTRFFDSKSLQDMLDKTREFAGVGTYTI